jgi:hypothetical protein
VPTSYVHAGALLRFWEDDVDNPHNRVPSLLEKPLGSCDVGGFEMDVKLIVDDLKGFRLLGLAVCFNEGPGRLDCCDDGCG